MKTKKGKSNTQAKKTNKSGIIQIKTKSGIGYVFNREQSALFGDKLLPVIENIEQFELSFGETVRLYPFIDKGPNVKLNSEQQSIMRDTCGWPVKPSTLRAFLRQNCNFTDFQKVTIFEILSAMRIYIQNNIPGDLMFTNVVLDLYHVSKTQLHIDIKNKVIKSYRLPGSKKHRLSEKEVSNTYNKKPK